MSSRKQGLRSGLGDYYNSIVWNTSIFSYGQSVIYLGHFILRVREMFSKAHISMDKRQSFCRKRRENLIEFLFTGKLGKTF